MASDPENINFLDLACLFKIIPETTLERFGSVINASVFDAANITGSLKQKGLIDFTAYYPGPNSIVVTDAGKKLEEEADAKSAEQMDDLDEEILWQMSGGKRFPAEMQSTLNLRPKDLALRLYKLGKQNYLGYELKNGKVELMLTEQGFLKAKSIQAVQAPAMSMQQQGAPQKTVAEQQMKEREDMSQVIEDIKKSKKGRRRLVFALAVVIAAILIFLVLYYLKLPPFTR